MVALWVALAVCGVLVVFPYTIYPAIMYALSRFIRNHGAETTATIISGDAYPYVSVFIPAYNEEAFIAEKISNALALTYPAERLEIVVASDGSDDKTAQIARSFSELYKNVRVLEYPCRRGKVNVMNSGIPECSGEIVVLTDANAMFNKEALVNLVRHFVDGTVGCVAGEKRIVDAGANDQAGEHEGLYWRFESFLKRLEGRVSTVIGADGAVYAIRKNLWRPLPSETPVDDFLLSMLIVKQGYRIVYEPGAISTEYSGGSLTNEFRRKVRIAAGNFYNLRYLKGLLGLNLISFMFLGHKFLRWISPFLLAAFTALVVATAVGGSWIGTWLVVGLLIVYLLAVLGYVSDGKVPGDKLTRTLTYFLMTVVAQLFGFFRYLSRSQGAVWEKARS